MNSPLPLTVFFSYESWNHTINPRCTCCQSTPSRTPNQYKPVPTLATVRNSASRWANINMTLMRWNCKLQRCSKSSVLNFPANMKYHKTRLFLVPHHTCALYIFQVDVADIGDKTLSFCLVEQVQGYGMSDGDDAGCRNPPACWGKLTFPWQGSLCPPGTRRPSSTSRYP